MGQSNFYRRSFGEESAPFETISYDDPMGLAKKVADELDLDETIDDIEGVTFFQEGKTIVIRDDNISPEEKVILYKHICKVLIKENDYKVDSLSNFCDNNRYHPQCP